MFVIICTKKSSRRTGLRQNGLAPKNLCAQPARAEKSSRRTGSRRNGLAPKRFRAETVSRRTGLRRNGLAPNRLAPNRPRRNGRAEPAAPKRPIPNGGNSVDAISARMEFDDTAKFPFERRQVVFLYQNESVIGEIGVVNFPFNSLL